MGSLAADLPRHSALVAVHVLLRLVKERAVELASAGDAGQRESVVELAREQLDDVLHAVGAPGSQPPQRRATDEDRLCSEGEGLDDVGAAANSVISSPAAPSMYPSRPSGSRRRAIWRIRSTLGIRMRCTARRVALSSIKPACCSWMTRPRRATSPSQFHSRSRGRSIPASPPVRFGGPRSPPLR